MNALQRTYHKYFPTYVHLLNRELRGCKSVLELGCGKNSPLRHVKKKWHAVGVDLFEDAINESKTRSIHDEYVIGDVLNVDFKERSFDAVIALDLIEHLKKEEGYKLLEHMQKFARKKVIIFTPNGFLEQGVLENNPFQQHHSGWSAQEMQKRGFRVYGVNGLKFLRGERARIKYSPKIVFEAISIISQIFTYFFPSHSFQIFCVKRIRRP